VFPINVIDNMFTAINRAIASNNFANTSANFSYNATSTHAQSEREIYVLVIGETSRADNWQIFGYDRPTNPLLSRRDSLISFPKALSESNTTHKSVPLMLSWVDNSNFGDSIYTSKSILEAFNEAGFNTAYLSNQGRNHSFIDFFAEEADTVNFLRDDGANHFDHELIEPFKNFIKQSNGKVFVVLHTYGSHFNYKDRYPREFAKFQPDESTSATVENLDQLINAYDNTIVYTDALLDNIIATLASQNCPAAVLYLSDHGEDIFDDSRHRFLHASPVPTYYQIHVPVVMWMSPKYTAAHPEKYTAAESHKDMDVSSSGIAFDTMLDLAGIATSYADPTKSLVSNMYKPTERRYLNDYNEGVALSASGLRHYDFENLKHKNISAN
jgi:glucan phosphoethanolaminetransferase (alkaline phosphatase superfamily)